MMVRWQMFVVLIVLAGFAVGCGGPKADARKWADRFPAEIMAEAEDDDAEPVVWWEMTDDRTDLSIETQANYGYSTVIYEGTADAIEDVLAYITVVVYANESAANVAQEATMLDWSLQGIRFEAERFGRDRFDFALMDGGLLGYYQMDATVFEVRIIPEDMPFELPEDAYKTIFQTILDTISAA